MTSPSMFGRYLLLDKVAAGGMAEVWRGKITGEASFQRIVAIKKILPHVAEDEDFITMFTDEALITASLVHANIGQVYEFSKIGDVFFIAMEYISGKDLKSIWSWSKSRGQIMPIELAAFIIMKMCDGLEYAHSRRDHTGNVSGVIHRDISPQNVLLSWEGDVKVIDFGIAKATEKSGKTRPGTLKGKFAYMAPEQIRGLPLDGRSDLFAVGVCLYEMCTGQRGFQAESEFSLLEMVRNVEIRPPSLLNTSLPAEMERIIYKSLAKDRDQRYASCADMSEDLQRFLLMKGKPPQARDLSAFLRENFTVDWEKERSRLEGYREVNAKDFQTNPVSVALPRTQSLVIDDSAFSSSGGGFSGVGGMVGVGGMMGADDDSAFAPSPGSIPEGRVAPGAGGTNARGGPSPHTQTGIRPASQNVSPVRSETTANTNANAGARPGDATMITSHATGPSSASKLPTYIGASLALLLLVGGGGFALWKTVLRPVSRVTLQVAAGPPKVTVRFDNLPPQEIATPGFLPFEKVELGKHSIIVEAPGYVPSTLRPVVESDTPLDLNVTLKRISGKLTIMSEPSGGAISIDGKPTDKRTPSSFELDGDSIHEVRVDLQDFKQAVAPDVRVKGGEEQVQRFKLAPTIIRLRVVTTPEGAMVKVGGMNLGTTPVVIERATDDPYPEVEITKDGCEPLKTTVPFDREKGEDRWEAKLKCK